jgi:pimeloyl-ACP methyl ester carboxylesterase
LAVGEIDSNGLEISLLGELEISRAGRPIALPASKKARALLAFLILTRRPHRRERLCELLWHLPDDPKAGLRWALTKLRKVVDTGERVRILADRERIQFDPTGVRVDITELFEQSRRQEDGLSIAALEAVAQKLGQILMDGLDGAGDEPFDAWLAAEREDAGALRAEVMHRLVTHPGISPILAQKWLRVWRESDPYGVDEFENRLTASQTKLPASSGSAPRKARGGDAMPTGDGAKTRRTARGRALRAQAIEFCQVRDGTKIAYATVGSGPPLFKAANWLSHLEFDWSSPIWGRSFAAIARERTFIRYDERGCGLSDWDVKHLDFGAFVEDLEAVADKVGVERFPLLGISQGAAVSIEYAVRHPSRVTGLILISGYAAGWRYLASPEEQARREAVLRLTELGWGTDNPAYRHIFSQTFMPEASQEDLKWFDEFQRRTTSPKNAARFQDAFGYIDVRHRLAEVKVPTIVLHSKHDQRIPLALGRAMAAGIPGAEFVTLESRNHILVDHEPAWKVCLERIGRFLEENRL